jgi:hypothetical protein
MTTDPDNYEDLDEPEDLIDVQVERDPPVWEKRRVSEFDGDRERDWDSVRKFRIENGDD